MVVIAGVIIGIVFLVSGNNNPASKSTACSTTTTAASKGGDATLQAQANEVAVKAGCPADHQDGGRTPRSTRPPPPMTIDTPSTYTATVKTTTGTFEASRSTPRRPPRR